MKFLTLPLTTTKGEREREEQKHNPTSKTFLKPLKNFSLVTLQARNQEIFRAGEFSWI